MGERGRIGLGTDGIAFTVEFLGEKFEFAAGAIVTAKQLASRSDMGIEAIQFLLKIEFGCKNCSLLMQPLGIKAVGLFQQSGKLILQA